MYIILSGEVRVTKQGKEIATLDSAGGTFGELSVIDGEARSASVHAVTDTACLAIDMSFMDRMGDEERKGFDAIYYRTLSEILAQRLRETSNHLTRVQGELEQLKGASSG
ncbi:MAG: cyclic nucleotide-binding domain-containing protein [Deltaproteobacteria bacterium]|nr:cyclic nucleotide-binding domain-containing protein [Deltaproteobacteria bacterium]